MDDADSIDRKVSHLKRKSLTQADELRTLLDQLDSRIGNLTHSTPEEALDIPVLMDQVVIILDDFQGKGVELREEEALFEEVAAQLKAKGEIFLRAAGGPRALENARAIVQPPEEHWWWYIDDLQTERLKARTRRLLLTGGAVILVLVILGGVYKLFFAPDPSQQASYRHMLSADRLISEGDFQGALEEIDQALTFTPDNPRLLLRKGIVLEALSQSAAARESIEAALALYSEEEHFLRERVYVYMLRGDVEKALADAEALLLIKPDSVTAYITIGGIYEFQGDYERALYSYQEADRLAQEQGDAEMQAIARVNMANLINMIGSQMPKPSGTP